MATHTDISRAERERMACERTELYTWSMTDRERRELDAEIALLRSRWPVRWNDETGRVELAR
jgi:hypothetical protein